MIHVAPTRDFWRLEKPKQGKNFKEGAMIVFDIYSGTLYARAFYAGGWPWFCVRSVQQFKCHAPGSPVTHERT